MDLNYWLEQYDIKSEDIPRVRSALIHYLNDQLEQVFSLNIEEREKEIQKNKVIHQLLEEL